MLTLFRRCLSLVGPRHRVRWVAVLVLALAAAGLEVLGALLLVWLLTVVTTAASGFSLPGVGDLRTLLPGLDPNTVAVVSGLLVGGVFVLRGAVIIVQGYVQSRVAENAGARLSARLLEGYLAMPWEFHLQRNSAELVRNSYSIVQQFVKEALIPGVKLVSSSLIIVGLVAVLLITSPAATLFALVTLGPVIWLLLRLVHPRVKKLGQVSQTASKTSLKTLNESLAGWRDIVILGRASFFVERFAADRRRMARARYLQAAARELPRVVLETCLVLFILGFLGVSLLVQGGALEALPTLGLFGYAVVRLQPSLNDVLVSLNSLKFAGPGVDALHADLELVRANDEAHGATRSVDGPVRPLRTDLRLSGVSAHYPGAHRDALTDVELTIRAGEFIGIVGATGGGKSTLVDIMLGLMEPSRGAVLVDGADVATAPAQWQATLGVVHQEVFLVDDTLRHNVALGVEGADVDDERVREAVRLAQLESFVAELPDGLDTVIGERGVKISGGQRQRLAIARALYRRPSVLFFDEGTSALDGDTEAQLMAGLSALRGERTIIAVAHRLSTVRECDRVVLIEDGRVRDVAPFAELATRHARLRVA